MQYDVFIERVQKQAGLETREEAVRITEATFETLGERLTKAEAENLATQLPKELEAQLFKREQTQRFSLEDFYTRVSARANIRYTPAADQAKAVIAVLRQAVSAGEIEDILAELPSEYKQLFA